MSFNVVVWPLIVSVISGMKPSDLHVPTFDPPATNSSCCFDFRNDSDVSKLLISAVDVLVH